VILKPKWNTGDWSNCTALDAGGEGSGDGSGDGAEADVVIAEGATGSGECPGYMFRNVFCDQVRLY
jgi:hypothetical protein